jgi:hypothetical protein
MKLHSPHVSRFTLHASRSPRRRSGSAVIVVLALLAIMLIYVTANLRTLASLGAELRLLERRQVQRLQKATHATNAPPAITVSTNAVLSTPNP